MTLSTFDEYGRQQHHATFDRDGEDRVDLKALEARLTRLEALLQAKLAPVLSEPASPSEVEEMLTPSQAARILDVTPERVRQLADNAGLPVTRTALGRLFTRADVEALAKARAQAKPA